MPAQYIRELYWDYEYEEVVTPNIYNFDLWKTSGHADHYKENMFLINIEKQEFGLKPMNCPGAQTQNLESMPLLFTTAAYSLHALPFVCVSTIKFTHMQIAMSPVINLFYEEYERDEAAALQGTA